MDVRSATSNDLPAITAIAVDAWRYAYSDLIGRDAVDQYLETSYSPVGLRNRINDHPIYVAADGPMVMAFADVFVQDGCVVVSELCTVPRWRRHGYATELLAHARTLRTSFPMTADVVLGNVVAEEFYERGGFVPGACTALDFFGEYIVERRWWQDAQES